MLEESKMADLSVEITGLTLRNPILTAAGPGARDGDTLRAAARGGAGGLVAKTVSVSAAEVPTPNIVAVRKGRVGSRRGVLNAELWSELPVEQWLDKEYRTALATGLPVIASLGYTPEDVASLAPKIEKAGVHALEFSTHYVGGHVEIAKALREAVEIPIFAKLSPKVDVVEVAKSLEPYVDGVVAINSLGPCLRINIETGKPMLGSESGYGWLSGASIRPVAIRCVADIARAIRKPVIGVGGVSDGEDAIEFIMAGAHAVEVCTAAILEGQTVYGRIASEMDKWLDAHGYDSVEDVRGLGLKHLTKKIAFTPPPKVDMEKCTLCGLCEKSCVYEAITTDKEGQELRFDKSRCQACGMCISVCPYDALSYN